MTSEPQSNPSLGDDTPPIINTPPRNNTLPLARPQLARPQLARPHPLLAYWVWLAFPTTILLLAGLMSAGPDRQVSLPGLGVFPETCTMHARFGIDCPGCGLTRSFIHLAHGDMFTAWGLNPVGLFIFAFVWLQIPLALGNLCGNRLVSWLQSLVKRATVWNQIILIGLLVALLIQWLVRIGFIATGV